MKPGLSISGRIDRNVFGFSRKFTGLALRGATLAIALGAAGCVQETGEDPSGVDPSFDALCDDGTVAGSGGAGSTGGAQTGGKTSTGGATSTPTTTAGSGGTGSAPSGSGSSTSGGTGSTGSTAGAAGAPTSAPAPTPAPAPTATCTGAACQCSDGKDNDGDGLVDWQNDLGCTAQGDNSEGGLTNNTLEGGWTVLNPSADTRVTYVSSSTGNDAWSGKLSAPNATGTDGPKRTLASGVAVMREGYPDWLLLRRGDTWSERLQVAASGRSLTEPSVISSYGTSLTQPLIRSDVGKSNKRTTQLTNVVVAHLAFEGAAGSTLVGFSGTDNVLVEGCRLQNGNFYVGTTLNRNFRIRRNVLVNEGFYLTQTNGLLVEENIVYKPVNHGMYITRGGNSNVTTRGNFVFKVPTAGGNQNAIMQRPGGLAEGNVVAGSRWYGIVMGSCNDGESTVCQPPVAAEVRGNLVMDGTEVGGGIGVGGDDVILPGAKVLDNMVVNSVGSALTSKGTDRLVQGNIFFNATPGIATGRNIRWVNNHFYATDGRLLVSGDDLPVVAGFVAQGNRFYANTDSNGWFTIPQRVGFAGWKTATGETGSGSAYTYMDSARTLAKYNASLGGIADRDAFFQQTLTQLRFTYRQQYSAAAVIAYFRAGFSMR